MLVLEGSFYMGATTLLAVVLVKILAQNLLHLLVGEVYFLKLEVVVWPCFLMAGMLFLVVSWIMNYYYRVLKKHSLLELLSQSGQY